MSRVRISSASFAVSTTPRVSSLTDTFSDGLIGSPWTSSASGTATIAETGGQLVVTLATANTLASYGDVFTSGTGYSLIGNALTIEVPTVPANVSGTEAYAALSQVSDGGNKLQWIREGATGLIAQKIVAGATTSLATLTYSATTHRWWRISESSGTTTFSTSPTGLAGSWTAQATTTVPFALTHLSVDIGAGTWQSVAAPGTATFDNLNILNEPLTTVASATTLNTRPVTVTAPSGLTTTATTLSQSSRVTTLGVTGTSSVTTVIATVPLGSGVLGQAPLAASLALSAGASGAAFTPTTSVALTTTVTTTTLSPRSATGTAAAALIATPSTQTMQATALSAQVTPFGPVTTVADTLGLDDQVVTIEDRAILITTASTLSLTTRQVTTTITLALITTATTLTQSSRVATLVGVGTGVLTTTRSILTLGTQSVSFSTYVLSTLHSSWQANLVAMTPRVAVYCDQRTRMGLKGIALVRIVPLPVLSTIGPASRVVLEATPRRRSLAVAS